VGRFCCDLLQGPDSFKADVYGKSILIQRTLYKQGGCVSKFSVRNGTNGKEVETKLAVVHDICDAFNIQIENPCAILMQETAKQFLTSASGAVKYRFFTDATRIAAAEKDYVTATDEITAVQATLVRLRDMLKDMRDKRDALEREAQAAQHLMELGSRIRAYENELLVSHLNDKIAELAELAEKVAAFESNRARLVRERDEADRAFEVARANREQSGASVESLKNETAVIAEEVKQITAQIQLERVALFEAETNASRVRQEMQSNERSLDRKRQARATLQREARAETMSRGERERVRVAEQDRLDDAAKAARERVEQRENDLKSHQERIRSMGADQQETRQRAEALKAAVTGAERELHKARASRTDALALFGDGASDVHKELKRVLGDRCIGPVGAVLKVRNPQWAFAIEACLIQDMFAYCVPDYDTLKEANDIVKRVNPRTRPSIIVQRASTLHNVSPEMRQKPNSILNQINNDVPALIINTLIDMHDVDRVLLFETEAQGNRELFGGRNANFRVALCQERHQAVAVERWRAVDGGVGGPARGQAHWRRRGAQHRGVGARAGGGEQRVRDGGVGVEDRAIRRFAAAQIGRGDGAHAVGARRGGREARVCRRRRVSLLGGQRRELEGGGAERARRGDCRARGDAAPARGERARVRRRRRHGPSTARRARGQAECGTGARRRAAQSVRRGAGRNGAAQRRRGRRRAQEAALDQWHCGAR
jgi:chromosome segregation ATPase